MITIDNKHFRPGTQTKAVEYIFDMKLPNAKTAAMGDMIAWLPSIVYVAENYNFVKGILIVPEYFFDVATNVMSKYPHWRVHTRIPDRIANGAPLKRPLEHPINATGMHLVDLGFLFFVGIVPPPEGTRDYPQLDLEDIELPKELEGKDYAVMTPGTSTVTRAISADNFNKIVDHLISKNITPVFLGTRDMSGRQIDFNVRYHLIRGLDLIGKTNLMQAAKIIQHSKFIMGVDNGLLHLAGMTDATILFGYTIAGPEQRRIPRPNGWTVEIHADKEKLPCLFCQERIRFFKDHHFTNCIYKENEPLCTKALNAETWIANIDMVLKGSNE